MSGVTNTVCCCDVGRTWYALKCPALIDSPCCNTGCDNAPDRIEFCDSYLQTLGIPLPPDFANFCYIIAYDCCLYLLEGNTAVTCPNPASPWPQNVGTLYAINPKITTSCCVAPPPVFPPNLPVGTMGDIIVPDCGPVVEPSIIPCNETIADCYEYCDMWGTVRALQITATSAALTVNELGVPWDIRCDHGPPDSVAIQTTRRVKYTVGPCEPCEVKNDVAQPMPCSFPQNCPNQQFVEWRFENTCPDCPPFRANDCCGGISPCDFDPDACAGVTDVRRSFRGEMCYSVQPTDDVYTRIAVSLTIPRCTAEANGLTAWTNAAIDAWVRGSFVTIQHQVPITTCWGDINAEILTVCGLRIEVISGNSEALADRINARLGTSLTATSWFPYFWFGTRQGCAYCDWDTAPSGPPPFATGDLIVIQDAFAPDQDRIIVNLAGVSQKHFACLSLAANTLDPDDNCLPFSASEGLPSRNCFISAQPNEQEPYKLSPAEWAASARWRWMLVEQRPQTQQICVAPFTFQTVELCPAVPPSGSIWPLDNLTIYDPQGQPIGTQFGWTVLCPQMPEPTSNCRCHPYVYEVAPCCPIDYPDCEEWYATHPLPEPCVNDNFQSLSPYIAYGPLAESLLCLPLRT